MNFQRWQTSKVRLVTVLADCSESFPTVEQGGKPKRSLKVSLSGGNSYEIAQVAGVCRSDNVRGELHRETRDQWRVPLEASAECWSTHMCEENNGRIRGDLPEPTQGLEQFLFSVRVENLTVRAAMTTQKTASVMGRN